MGGMMAYAYKIFLGNTDVMFTLISWGFLVFVVFIILKIRRDLIGG